MSFVADNIKYSRKLKKYTQAQIAEMLGVTRGTIANYESEISQPPIDMLIKIAKLFDTSVENLVSKSLANDRLAFCYRSTGNLPSEPGDLVQVSGVFEVNDAPQRYQSSEDEVQFLRMRINELELFISQKFPDFKPGQSLK